jgi:hypothetical protein
MQNVPVDWNELHWYVSYMTPMLERLLLISSFSTALVGVAII